MFNSAWFPSNRRRRVYGVVLDAGLRAVPAATEEMRRSLKNGMNGSGFGVDRDAWDAAFSDDQMAQLLERAASVAPAHRSAFKATKITAAVGQELESIMPISEQLKNPAAIGERLAKQID